MNDTQYDSADFPTSSFSFSWGTVSIHVSGDVALVREGFALLKEEVLPKLTAAPRVEEQPATPAASEAPTSAPPVGRTTGAAEPSPAGPTDAAEPPAPSAFLDFKSPKTAQETAAVLAYYLKTYRDANDFTVGQMEALINEAHRPMKNMQNAIWNAGRKDYGWIKRVAGKKGNYYLTAAGENYVKTQLPKKAK